MSKMQSLQTDVTGIHLARSKFLDAFAQLEANLSAILKAGGISSSNTPISLRLNDFRKLEANPRLAKQNLGRLNQLADKIASMMPVRTDIVHSALIGCIVDGVATAKIVNAQLVGDRHPTCRLLNENDFNRLTDEASEIAASLLALARVNPASSPPPPSPGAAGDP